MKPTGEERRDALLRLAANIHELSTTLEETQQRIVSDLRRQADLVSWPGHHVVYVGGNLPIAVHVIDFPPIAFVDHFEATRGSVNVLHGLRRAGTNAATLNKILRNLRLSYSEDSGISTFSIGLFGTVLGILRRYSVVYEPLNSSAPQLTKEAVGYLDIVREWRRAR